MEGMRDLLRRNLHRALRDLTPLDRLAAAWPVACGRAMAERGEVIGLSAGVVEVQVADSLWLSQMLSMRSVLQNDLTRISGVPLTGIHFHLRQGKPAAGETTHP